MEFGEHPEEALVREIREETGLEARTWAFLNLGSETEMYRGREFHLTRFFYAVTEFDGELKFELGGTTDECRWIREDELSAFPTVPIVSLGLQYRSSL